MKRVLMQFWTAGALAMAALPLAADPAVTATRLDGDPSTPGIDPVLDVRTFRAASAEGEENINGPSVMRVPDWIPASERTHPTAQYYMYFANHNGKAIRLAWAPAVTGPWRLFNMGDAPDQAWGTGQYSGTRTPGDGVLDLTLDEDESAPAPGNKDIRIDGPGGVYRIGDEIASPDVFVDDTNQRIVMYFHGDSWGENRDRAAVDRAGRSLAGQHTYVTTSKYGLNFNHGDQADPAGNGPHGIRSALLSQFYARVFEVQGEADGKPVTKTFAFTNRGFLYTGPLFTRSGENATIANADAPGGLWHPSENEGAWWSLVPQSSNPLDGIRMSPEIDARTRDDGGSGERPFGEMTNDATPRHFAIYHNPEVDRDTIDVFYTSRGDRPESIVFVQLSLAGLTEQQRLDPSQWRRVNDTEQLILTPELDWEGADQPQRYSRNGFQVDVNQLRDPYVFEDSDGAVYLFYTGEGEEAIGVAKLTFGPAEVEAASDPDPGPWRRHVIGPGAGSDGFVGADGVRTGDINGDGNLDLVAPFEGSGITRVYLHPGKDGLVTEPWPSVTVGETPNAEDAFFADIDGDGRLDVVTSDESGNGANPKGQIRVHFAPPDASDLLDPEKWLTTMIPAAAHVTEWMYGVAMQVDGEHGLDLVVAGKNHEQRGGPPTSQIGWLRAPADPRHDPDGWAYFPIDKLGWTMSVVARDMDGDTDLDVLISDRRSDDAGVGWLENPAINPRGHELTEPWIAHVVGMEGGGPALLDVGDLNGDGLDDIVVPTVDSHLVWFERLDGSGTRWQEHTLTWPEKFGQGKAATVADVNQDGRPDIVLSCKSMHIDEPGLLWLESPGRPEDADWIRHDVSGEDYGKYDLIQMIDVDGDGDLDAITTEEQVDRHGLGVVWYENPLVSASRSTSSAGR